MGVKLLSVLCPQGFIDLSAKTLTSWPKINSLGFLL